MGIEIGFGRTRSQEKRTPVIVSTWVPPTVLWHGSMKRFSVLFRGTKEK